jgi:hypothetical protein
MSIPVSVQAAETGAVVEERFGALKKLCFGAAAFRTFGGRRPLSAEGHPPEGAAALSALIIDGRHDRLL